MNYPAQARANDTYLMQRISGATPEQLVALLLEGAQRFLAQAVQAMARKDFQTKAQTLDRVLAILQELELRLDTENGGDLARNLHGLYQWWGGEVLAAGASLEPARLERVSAFMGEIRQTWELASRQRMGAGSATAFTVGNLVG